MLLSCFSVLGICKNVLFLVGNQPRCIEYSLFFHCFFISDCDGDQREVIYIELFCKTIFIRTFPFKFDLNICSVS